MINKIHFILSFIIIYYLYYGLTVEILYNEEGMNSLSTCNIVLVLLFFVALLSSRKR